LNIGFEQMKVLSLGTGHSKTFYGTDLDKSWGFLNGWKNKQFIDYIMSLQAQSAHNSLKLALSEHQWLRIDFESDQPLPLDDCAAIDNLISRADGEFTHQ